MQDNNVFTPNLSSPAAYTHISAPVRNEALEKAVDIGLSTGVAAARAEAVNDLLGDSRTASEATAGMGEGAGFREDQNILEQIDPAAQAEAQASINNLQDLSRKRQAKLINYNQANLTARALLARAVNDNPLFADDIRNAYQSYFGGVGAKQLFSQTEEEKAIEKAEAEIITISHETGLTIQKSRQLKQQERLNEFQLQDNKRIQSDRGVNAANFAVGTDALVRQKVIAFSGDLLSRLKNGGGSITPEEKPVILNSIEALKQAALDEVMDSSIQEVNGRRTVAVDQPTLEKAQQKVIQEMDALRSLVESNEQLKVFQDLSNQKGAEYNINLLQTYGSVKAARDALGDETFSLMLQSSANNEAWMQVFNNSPTGKALWQGVNNFEDSFSSVVSITGMFLGGQLPDEDVAGIDKQAVPAIAKQSLAAMINTKDGYKLFNGALKQSGPEAVAALSQALKSHPEAVVAFSKRNWVAGVGMDVAEMTPVIDEALRSSALGVRSQIITASNTFNPIVNISVSTQTSGRSKGTGSLEVTVGDATKISTTRSGRSTSSSADLAEVNGMVQQRVREAYDVAINTPSLWKNDYESALEYIQDIYGSPVQAKGE